MDFTAVAVKFNFIGHQKLFLKERKWQKCLIMICRSSSANIFNREWILPLNDNSELPGKFYWEKIPLASIIVSRTWKLRFTSKRISRYRSGLLSMLQRNTLSIKTPHKFCQSQWCAKCRSRGHSTCLKST